MQQYFKGIKDLASYLSNKYCRYYTPLSREKDPRIIGEEKHKKIVRELRKYFESRGYECEEEKPLECVFWYNEEEQRGKIDLYCYNESIREALIIEAKSYNMRKLHQADILQLIAYTQCLKNKDKFVKYEALLALGANPTILVRVNTESIDEISGYIKRRDLLTPGYWCTTCGKRDCPFRVESNE